MINPVAWLIGLALPACGFPGAEGLPMPQPMDVAQIVRPSSPNTALAAPSGFSPAPDIETPTYQMPPERLFALVRDVAGNEPRVVEAALYPAQFQVHYVARSALFNFPDLVTIQVRQSGADGSNLIIYSRSVYGHSDLGVNRKRIDSWLSALQAKTSSSSGR